MKTPQILNPLNHVKPCNALTFHARRYRAQAFWPPAEVPGLSLDPAVVLAEAAQLPPAPEWSSLQVRPRARGAVPEQHPRVRHFSVQ